MSLDTAPRPAASNEPVDPVDGLDGDIEIRPSQIAHRIFAFFYNKRVGLLLILAAGVLSLIGVLFSQMPSGVKDDPDRHAAWLEQVRPTYGGWTDILDSLGFFHVFSSIPFLTVMALLCISIAACTIHRVPLLKRTAFEPRTHVTSKFFGRARLHSSFTTDAGVDESMDTVIKDLKSKRVRVIEDDKGPGRNVYTDKNHLAPFGTVFAHVAFIVIIAGFLISAFTGFRDNQFTLTIDQPREVGHGTDLVAEAKGFIADYYENGSPKDYVTDLVITRDGEVVAQQDVRVNSPLTIDGIMFHQAYFGISAVVNITDANGNELFSGGLPLEWQADGGTYIYGYYDDIPGYEVYVVAPASGVTSSLIAPGQVRVEVYPAGVQEPIANEVIDQGETVSADDLRVTYEREQQFTGILVKKDPGALIVWIGCGLLVFGTCITMFFRHHRIWVRAEEVEGRTVVRLASPDKADSIFTRQFNELTDRLSTRLGGTREGSNHA